MNEQGKENHMHKTIRTIVIVVVVVAAVALTMHLLVSSGTLDVPGLFRRLHGG
jgi:hypothetical protein